MTEGREPEYGRLVDALSLVDVVNGSVRRDGALYWEAGKPIRLGNAEVLNDVVLDEWVGRPTVE